MSQRLNKIKVSTELSSLQKVQREESAPKLILVAGRIHFLIALELRGMASHWLAGGGCVQFLHMDTNFIIMVRRISSSELH